MAPMEDFLDTEISNVDGQVITFFGVFDGYYGSGAAVYVKMDLFYHLMKHLESDGNTMPAIAEACRQTNQNWLKAEHDQSQVVMSGSG